MLARLFAPSTGTEPNTLETEIIKIKGGVRKNLLHLQPCLQYLNKLNSKDYPITTWEALDTMWQEILRNNQISRKDLFEKAANLAEYTLQIRDLVKQKKWDRVVNNIAEIIGLCVQIQSHIENDRHYSSHIEKMMRLQNEITDPVSLSLENLNKYIEDFNAEIETLKNTLSAYEMAQKSAFETAREEDANRRKGMSIN